MAADAGCVYGRAPAAGGYAGCEEAGDRDVGADVGVGGAEGAGSEDAGARDGATVN